MSGLQHEVINNDFVITYVPNHPEAPFQTGTERGVYYMRIGGASRGMPHRYVESLILSKQKPTLKYRMFNQSSSFDDHLKYGDTKYSFSITNMSPVTARDLIVFCHSSLDGRFYAHSPADVPRFRDHRLGDNHTFKALRPFSPNLLHPGMEFEIDFTYLSSSDQTQFTDLTFIISYENQSLVYRLIILLLKSPSTRSFSYDLILLPSVSEQDQINFLQGEDVPSTRYLRTNFANCLEVLES